MYEGAIGQPQDGDTRFSEHSLKRAAASRSSGRWRLLLSLLCWIAVALCACGDNGLASVALASPPVQGYTAQPVGDNGSLTLDDAATATPADPMHVRQLLTTRSWAGAFERIWAAGDDYLVDLIYEFPTAESASAFATLEISEIKANAANFVYAVSPVRNAQGFVLYSQTRQGGKNVFCNGVWFSIHARAFETLDCSSSPNGGTVALQMAMQQAQRAP